MPGSMDDNPPIIVGKNDYDYFVISRDKEHQAEIHLSPNSRMTFAEIAAELRRVAAFVEKVGRRDE